MVKKSTLFIVLGSVLLLASTSVELAQYRHEPPKAKGQVLVKFKRDTKENTKTKVRSRAPGQLKKRFKALADLELLELADGVLVDEAVELLRQDPNVAYAEPNYTVHLVGTPNDTFFGDLWGLHNTGQEGGTPDSDIDAPEAWDIVSGSSSVVVAVIDSGIDYTHEDLAANMFRNVVDCNSDGFDDDGNGFVDDCYGIDTMNDDADPMDDNGHGTHVAGTIGAVGNNGIGVVGVNHNIQIMACKFVSSEGEGSIADVIDCLDYVAAMKDSGVNVVATSNSWGGPDFSQALEDAIEVHLQRGILFVSAAGNGNVLGIGQDNDTAPFYPCNTHLPHILCVSAVDSNDNRAGFSNFGKRTVDIDAPGVGILSTTPGNNYEYSDGTSMATPHVAGTVGLLAASDPSLDWRATKNLILAGGDSVPGLENTVTAKRLNALGVFTCSESTILSRLLPTSDTAYVPEGQVVQLAALHINCASPNGSIDVSVDQTGEILTLLDDGAGSDRIAGDGIYSTEWIRPTSETYTINFPGGDIVTVVTGEPGVLIITPDQLDFGGVAVGHAITKNVTVTNIGGDILIGFAATASPFSVAGLGLYVLLPGQSQPLPIGFAPNSPTTFLGNVAFDGSGGSVSVTGYGTEIDSIAPHSIDLASPPTGFTITGNGFEDYGFGLPVANFYSGNEILGQARATSSLGTSIVVPYPSVDTSLGTPHPGLAAGALVVQVFNQIGPNEWRLIGSVNLAAEDTTPWPEVSSISPNLVNLASPPSGFTLGGIGLEDLGFGLPVANFFKGTTIVAQARATSASGTSLAIPFPDDETAVSGPHPGLSEGSVSVEVYLQTAPDDWAFVGSTALEVTDSRPPITPNPIQLFAPPESFTITGTGFVDAGFGLPVVNFYEGNTVAAQARATADNGISITVPFPSDETSLGGPKPGLHSGTFLAKVFNQTGANSWAQIGSYSLTVEDSAITPNPVDLAFPPSTFTVSGGEFQGFGFGLPVANFYTGSTVVAQSRAIAMNETDLTIPFPSDSTSVGGPHPGLTLGVFTVKIFNQTGPSNWQLSGSTSLLVEDSTNSQPRIDSITPQAIDLASPPLDFTVEGIGFADSGYGLPVANFYDGTVIVAQARAVANDGLILTVPFPDDSTSLNGGHRGLRAGSLVVKVFNQTGANAWFEVGATSLYVEDSRPPISPNPIDLAFPPPTFTITGTGFDDFGFGLPVVNFYSGGSVVAQARATSDNGLDITVPFPTNETSLGGPKPGLSPGIFLVKVFSQTGQNGWVLLTTTSLTVEDSVQ